MRIHGWIWLVGMSVALCGTGWAVCPTGECSYKQGTGVPPPYNTCIPCRESTPTTTPTTTTPTTHATATTLPPLGAYTPRRCQMSAGAVGLAGAMTFSRLINPDTGGVLTQFCVRDAVLRGRYLYAPTVLRAVRAMHPGCSGLARAISLLNDTNAIIVKKVIGRLAHTPPREWFFREDNYNRLWLLAALGHLCGCLEGRPLGPVAADLCGRSDWQPAPYTSTGAPRTEGLLTTRAAEPLTARQHALLAASHAAHAALGVAIQTAIHEIAATYGVPPERPLTGPAALAVIARVDAVPTTLTATRAALVDSAASERQEALLTIPPHPTTIDWHRPWGEIVHLFDVADACHATWHDAVARGDAFGAWFAGHVCHAQTHDQIATYVPGLTYCDPANRSGGCPVVAHF